LLEQHGEERALLNEALEIVKFYSKKNVQVCKYLGRTPSGHGSHYKIIDKGNKARNFLLKIKRMSKQEELS
jgi:hypothetical protein